MSKRFQKSLYESVLLAMAGVTKHYTEGADMAPAKRTKLVEIVQDIKARERLEMINAIMRGVAK